MPKFLLITNTTIYIPGDERSRTNPGHGYPESTEKVPVLKWFDTDEELLTYMEHRGTDLRDPQIFEIAGKVQLERKVSLSLKPSN